MLSAIGAAKTSSISIPAPSMALISFVKCALPDVTKRVLASSLPPLAPPGLPNIFLPSIANALTSGPTTPETSSFEPVDTTDMVNLLTGDFTYNIQVNIPNVLRL